MTPISAVPPTDAEQRGSARTYRRIALFWTVILYISLGLGLYHTALDTPERLRGWSAVLLGAALIAFCGTYHLLYLRRDNWWPMPRRRALAYFPLMIVLVTVLLWYSPGFNGIAYALLAHICTLLPWRHWIAPIGALVAVLAWSYGLFSGDLSNLLVFLFSIAVLLGVFVNFYMVMRQRQRLADTVAELRLAQQQLQRSAVQVEELAVLRERTRLAREMHDSIGHALVAVNVKLEAAERLYRRAPAQGDAELAATRALVRATMTELRRSLADMRAPVSSYADLPRALQQLAAERSTGSLAVEIRVMAGLPPLPEPACEALWLVAREALANVAQHAAAASATLELCAADGAALLRVIDDGSGIGPDAVGRPGHFGILGMQERMAAVGGTLTLRARPAGGTIVEASAPLEQPCQSQPPPPTSAC